MWLYSIKISNLYKLTNKRFFLTKNDTSWNVPRIMQNIDLLNRICDFAILIHSISL